MSSAGSLLHCCPHPGYFKSCCTHWTCMWFLSVGNIRTCWRDTWTKSVLRPSKRSSCVLFGLLWWGGLKILSEKDGMSIWLWERQKNASFSSQLWSHEPLKCVCCSAFIIAVWMLMRRCQRCQSRVYSCCTSHTSHVSQTGGGGTSNQKKETCTPPTPEIPTHGHVPDFL